MSFLHKPTIQIIPGSFASPLVYEDLRRELVDLGYEAIITPLLSAGSRDPEPPATMGDDATYIRSVTSKLVEEDKEVVLVMHSYGGIPGSESTKGLLKKDRQAAGKHGGVVRLVYLSALVIPVGKSMDDMFGGHFPDFLKSDEDYVYQEPTGSAKLTYSDLPYEQALKEAENMQSQSIVSFLGRLSYPAYNESPVSYITCSEDMIIPPELQKYMIEKVIEKGGKTKVDVYSMVSGHCPMTSQPKNTAKMVLKAASLGA